MVFIDCIIWPERCSTLAADTNPLFENKRWQYARVIHPKVYHAEAQSSKWDWGWNKLLRSASEPNSTPAQFNRAVAEVRPSSHLADCGRLLRGRLCDGDILRAAKGRIVLKRTIFRCPTCRRSPDLAQGREVPPPGKTYHHIWEEDSLLPWWHILKRKRLCHTQSSPSLHWCCWMLLHSGRIC